MAHRPRRAIEAGQESEATPKLEPVGTVKRELVSPAGHKVLVDVPVYPPFRLEVPKKRRSEVQRASAGRTDDEDGDPFDSEDEEE